MTSLITGATGFVGSAVARKLVEAGEDVRVVVRPGSDRSNIDGLKIEIVEGDLRDRVSLERAAKGCASVYHVAADYRLWLRRPAEMYANNVEGTANVMRAAGEAGVRRIVYTSSVAVLGLNADGSPADEDTPVGLGDMIGHYKRSKFMADEAVRRMVAEDGLPAVIVNPSTPIGPRDIKPTPTGRMIVEAASGRIPAYVDTGLNVAHVDDVAAGHLLAHERGVPGARYILGGENLTLRRILTEIAGIVGGKAPTVRLPHNLLLPVALFAEGWAWIGGGREPMTTVSGVRLAKKKMFFTCEKARREIGYDPRPAGEALRDAIAWFRAHGYCR